MSLAVTKGKKYALKALDQRRKENSKKKKIDNRDLYAGSSMYFYCKSCDGLSDVLPEDYTSKPKRLCDECQALKDQDWLDE